ncbi:MAG: extracellular solute-binding protein [Chloroflexi bacterium]|nr:extracellular solute-binding protein [Chloroflexota bacterium]
MRNPFGLIIALMLTLSACSTSSSTDGDTPSLKASDAPTTAASQSATEPIAPTAGTVSLYTSTTQGTVDAIIAAFTERYPDVEVELFRAPTGEINARLATERREGTIRGDVLWLSDPLSIQQYDADGLLRDWTPAEVDAVPDQYRSDRFWGTRLLNVVMIHGSDVDPAPTAWSDLADPAFRDSVAIIDPGFAGSAFGSLGYFATSDEFGMQFYTDLAANGATQLSAPDEVVTGVAEDRFKVGITLETPAQAAVDNGSPIEIVWPEPGAIAIYSPIGVFSDTDNPEAAEALVDFILSEEGQTIIGETGFQPIREGVDGPPVNGDQVAPDWTTIFNRQDELLEAYRAIFGE